MATDAASLYAAAGASSALLDSIFKTEAVGHILMMVNVVVLAAGTGWLMWNILAGITQSAWDGELLGKRFHTLWMPIRNALGFAMLIPAFGGWGAAQLILYQSAKMGAGAANMAISGGAGAYMAPKVTDFAVPVATDYFPLARQIFDMHACRERAKIRAQQMADPSAELGGSPQDWERFVDLAGCGEIISVPSGALHDAHASATRALDATMQALAMRVVAGTEGRGPVVPPTQIGQQIRAAAQVYKLSIAAAARAAMDSKIGQIATSNSHGDWLGFGFRTIAAAQASREVNGATGDTATLRGNSNQGSAGRETAGAMYNDPGDPALATESFSASTTVTGAPADSATGAKDMLDMLKNAPAAILRWMFGGADPASVMATMAGEGGDLIGALQAVGTGILNIGSTAVLALIVLFGGLIWLGPLAAGAIPVAMWVCGLAFAILTPLFAMGITLAAYIPLVPGIFWALAILGWLLTVAEAMFMAPLWAFIHLETEGEGMGQKTEKGYAFIMNLILRPLVLVFTFTIASLLLNTVWAMVGSYIRDAMKAVNLLSFAGIAIWLGLIFVLVSTATAMIYKVYGAAIGLADAIPAWLGTNFHNYTSGWEQGGGFGHGSAVGGAAGEHSVRGATGLMQYRPTPAGSDNTPPPGGAGGGTRGG